MVGKMPNITWLEGTFMDTIKGWQSGWFYITEPHDSNWVVAPEFRSGIPMRLTSLQERGLTWSPLDELTGLQSCIQNMVDKKLKLVNIVQVMLVRRILPCQQREFTLWELNPVQHRTLNRLFDMTHEDAWRVLFKGAAVPSPITKDREFSAKRYASAVSCFTSYMIFVLYIDWLYAGSKLP